MRRLRRAAWPRLGLVVVAISSLGARCDNWTSKVECVSSLSVGVEACVHACAPGSLTWTADPYQGDGCGWCHCEGAELPYGSQEGIDE